MVLKQGFSFVVVMLLPSGLWAQEGPNRPEPKPVTLDSKTAAV